MDQETILLEFSSFSEMGMGNLYINSSTYPF